MVKSERNTFYRNAFLYYLIKLVIYLFEVGFVLELYDLSIRPQIGLGLFLTKSLMSD